MVVKSDIVKLIIKIFLYSLLLILFLKFYFIEEISTFLEGKTTFATTYETKNSRIPTIILCSLPDYKVGKGWFSTHDWNEFENNTFTMDKDFELYYIKLTMPPGRQRLHRGTNNFDDYYINVSLISTFGPIGTAMCHMISTNATQVQMGSNAFGLTMIDHPDLPVLLSSDFRFLTMFVDDQNWHEIIFDEFRYSLYTKYKLPIRPDEITKFIASSVSMTEVKYLNGVQDREKCIYDYILSKSNCTQVCAPLMLDFIPKLTLCSTFDDFLCMVKFIDSQKRKNGLSDTCFPTAKTTKYHIEEDIERIVAQGFAGLWISFQHVSSRIEVKEETLFLSMSGLIGSVGGSLGLFLGFSFYTYIVDLMDFIFSKLTIINQS